MRSVFLLRFADYLGMFPGTTQNLLISIVPIIVKLIVTLIATFAIIEQQGRKLPLMVCGISQ